MVKTSECSFCDEQHATAIQSFFGRQAPRFPGGERRYAQALENVRQCAAFRSRAAPGVASFLGAQPARHAKR